MSAAIALQIAIRDRLVATAAVTDRVPADCILDRHARPTGAACIVLGEAQELPDGDIERRRVRIFHTVHVWAAEPSLVGAMQIASLVRTAVLDARLATAAPYHCVGAGVPGIRTLRDPDGEHSHAVVTIEAVVEEIVA